MKEIIGSVIISAAILGSTVLYIKSQPKYEFQIISDRADYTSAFNSLTIRTDVRTGERCLVPGEGVLKGNLRNWEDKLVTMPGPTKFCKADDKSRILSVHDFFTQMRS